MKRQLHDFVTQPMIVREFIDVHRSWIESRIGVPISDVVILDTRLNFSQLGLEGILGIPQEAPAVSKLVRRLRSFVASIDIPPGIPPIIGYSKGRPEPTYRDILGGISRPSSSRTEWLDCPVALHLHAISCPVVAANIHFHPGPSSNGDVMVCVLITAKSCLGQLIQLLETVDDRESTPKLHTHHGGSRRIAPCSWEDLVLDPAISSLLKSDFEQFWNREQWFHQHHLPFRRGYLLHGPPGNGKSTAVRAMMCSRKLGAFTIRLFDRNSTDSDLEELFDTALRERPAMILLEDIDRAFPRTGESRTQISLQHLLNCLDGVATGEGIVVVATANEPTALDPAILRRPGRFDRVVCFPNPNATLRGKYFQWMNAAFTEVELLRPIAESTGFSFAQLRECFVLAAQLSTHPDFEVTGEQLLNGIRTLRHTFVQSSKHSNSAGFAEPLIGEQMVQVGNSREPTR